MAYRIPVSPSTGVQYRIAFPSDHVKSDHYKTPCISAIESELISLLRCLRHECELKNGYPSVVVSAGIHLTENALLLLSEHRRELLRGTPIKRLIGTPPKQALSDLHAYHQGLAERRVLQAAQKGETHWFAPSHWDLLRKLSPDLANTLAPAHAGK